MQQQTTASNVLILITLLLSIQSAHTAGETYKFSINIELISCLSFYSTQWIHHSMRAIDTLWHGIGEKMPAKDMKSGRIARKTHQINMACLCLYCTRVVYELHVLIIISGSPRLQWPIIDLFSVIWLMDTNDEKLLFENKVFMFINHNIRCGSHSAHTSGSFYLFVWILHGSNWIHICTWHIHSSHDSDHNNNGSHGASTPDRMQS